MDFTYKGQYGYHPLLVSLANTAEPLFLFNRSGNRPSQELADVFLDKAVTLCRHAGFRKILMRGDTKFAQTKHLDRWDEAGDIRFIFGFEAHDCLKAKADELPADAYSLLERPQKYQIKTTPREKPERVKQEIVRERGYETVHLLEEMVAEFEYQPVACKKSYRMIVLRKLVGVDKGQMRLFEEYRYFFYITNDRKMTAEEVVFSANDRCEQENLIAHGTDYGIEASFEQIETARGSDDRGCFISSAYSSATRHAAKSAEPDRARNMAWQSLVRTGRPGVRAC
jgi:hypothetical protein